MRACVQHNRSDGKALPEFVKLCCVDGTVYRQFSFVILFSYTTQLCESGVKALVILNCADVEVIAQLHAVAALLREKSAGYTLNRRLDERHSRSGRFGEDKNMLSPPAIERFFGYAALSLVTIATTLSRLPLIGLAKA